ncbi:FKBP-type peptidyl-prolyl cis-trans isomerase [Aurantiacibacter marinus]|uniref:Peptidyl-prolyl cis-trans isomerase n=1 Tax=Aurantiacibacter marinus TaxID=874156 RepID=A0A0H0XQN6_9SPHN|nr:FKBP-type peptidyl-prolyl cis-trans isomerase [Aurantiacibacter marinus]KLI64267.1 peptidylprolyl isomerase [Aurantiacibacter marinus]
MTEVTRVPLQPIAKGSLTKLWLGVLVAVLVAAAIAWAAMPKGLTVDTITAGEGPNPTAEDVVFLRYTGKLADGTVFDQTEAGGWPVPGILPDGAALPLGQMIPGFTEAVVQMQKGGSYEVFIPAEKGYGEDVPADGPIPPNSDLYFDITLVDFMSEEEAQQKYMTMMQVLQEAQGAEGAPGQGTAPQPVPQPAPQ